MARTRGAVLLEQWRDGRTKRLAATRIGVHESVYNRLESGDRKPTYEQAQAIEDATGVPMRAWAEKAPRRGRA